MSKGLEAFDEVETIVEFCDGITSSEIERARQNMGYIKKELKALEILMELIDFEVDLYNHNLITNLGTIDFTNANIDTIKKLELLIEVLKNE